MQINVVPLRKAVFCLLRMTAAPYLFREVVQRHRVTILAYHRISPEAADCHFDVLRQEYNIIGLSDYLSYRAGAKKSLPPKPLIVTFDDGHKDNYWLKPLFKKHGIPATVFLCSGIVASNRHFWFETEINDSVREHMKHIADSERLNMLLEIGFSETAEQASRQALSACEIEDMKSFVDFQSHTIYHPMLPKCSESRAYSEISGSKAELEHKFGLSINALAYPNGDYSVREIEAAERSGYACAVTTDWGFNTRTTPVFQLKRICINDDASTDELVVKASGVWGFLKCLIPSRFRVGNSDSTSHNDND